VFGLPKKRNGGVCETTGTAVIVGNSRGFVRMFSILRTGGINHVYQNHSFCLCPGVPIAQIKVDEDYLPRRLKQNRPWITVISALGEVYYLRKSPLGSTVKDWQMIPQTARIPTDLYYEVFPDLPDTVSGECLKQNVAERTALLLKMDYYKIRELWQGCRMDWIVEVDWAGENIITGRTGSESYWHGTLVERADVPLRRYHPRKRESAVSDSFVAGAGVVRRPTDIPSKESLFGDDPGIYTLSAELPEEGRLSDLGDEWLCTELCLNRESFSRITAYGLDNSILARFAAGEDPSLRDGLPGGNGRLFAVGTNTGSIFVFNIRSTTQHEPVELPIRSIHTESPQISTLAVSSLIVVHGGDDGLVQAWDPLGSAAAPVRTIHSKFSARARRRIEQNAGAAVSDNQFAARSLVLDPDPTNLRGVVALGTFIRYWSFSGYTGSNLNKKRKKIGAGRRGNATPSRVKIQLKADIHSDEIALRKEQERQRKEAEELEKRYGIGSGRTALSEEEMLAYARMISQESYEMESSSRSEVASSLSGRSADAATPDGLGRINRAAVDPGDVDLERALRLSLQDVEVNEMCDQGDDIWEHASELLAMEAGPSRYTLDPFSLSPSPTASSTSSPRRNPPKKAGWEKVSLEDWPSIGSDKGKWKQPNPPVEQQKQAFEDDLELAIRLSLQEYEGSGVKGKGVA